MQSKTQQTTFYSKIPINSDILYPILNVVWVYKCAFSLTECISSTPFRFLSPLHSSSSHSVSFHLSNSRLSLQADPRKSPEKPFTAHPFGKWSNCGYSQADNLQPVFHSLSFGFSPAMSLQSFCKEIIWNMDRRPPKMTYLTTSTSLF